MKQNKHEQHINVNMMELIRHYLRIIMELMQSFAVGQLLILGKDCCWVTFIFKLVFDGETFVQGLSGSHCIADKHCWRPNQTHAAKSCK